MNAPPAFQFYANDFLGATAEMSTGEVGAFIRLLCYQWVNGSVPNDAAKCARLASASTTEIAEVWPKFALGSDGRMRNPRLETVRVEREQYAESRRENGQKGGRPKKTEMEPTENHMVSGSLTETKPTGNLEGNLRESSSSSSSSSSSDPSSTSTSDPTPNPSPGAAASPPLGGGEAAALKVDKNLPTTDQAMFIASLFNRRLTTAWSDKEIKALKKLGAIDMNDLHSMGRYYAAERGRGEELGRHRRDMLTFLNNFHGELDRARLHSERPSKATMNGEYPEDIPCPIIHV